jgi:large subunit ribosomal protein L7/L12
VTELRCTGCFAPIDPSYGAVQKCPYCGATLVIDQPAGKAVAPAKPGELVLRGCGGNLIMVIKTIREHTGLGLKDSKDLAERAPCTVAAWDDPERMERFRRALIAAGAEVG